MATLRVAECIKDFKGVLQKAMVAAGAGWHGELAKYPPQKPSAGQLKGSRTSLGGRKRSGQFVGYKRTGKLGLKATYKLEVTSVALGGVYYTPYVILPRKKPASLAGKTIWPGKYDAAISEAERAFKVTIINAAKKGV